MFVYGVGLFGAGVLLVFLSLTCVPGNLRDIWSSGGERVRALTYLVVRTTQLHFVFGTLLSVEDRWGCAGRLLTARAATATTTGR